MVRKCLKSHRGFLSKSEMSFIDFLLILNFLFSGHLSVVARLGTLHPELNVSCLGLLFE